MSIRQNLKEILLYINNLGWINGTIVFIKIKFKKTESIHLNHIKYPFKLRRGSSDQWTFRQIFISQQYHFNPKREPHFIIDGGGNIGLAAIYFANRFPNATIVSIEPEAENYELLQYNTRGYKNIHPVKSGIWNKDTFLKVKDIGIGSWGFTVEEAVEGKDTFKAISISDIMKRFNVNEIDILKLDVEGAEKEIFSENYQDWLPRTNLLVIELHDRLRKGCSKVFFRAISAYDFSVHPTGENLICTKESDTSV